MKKMLLYAVGLGLISGSAFAACLPNNVLCYNESRITTNIPLQSYTVATATNTVFAVGTPIFCSNCNGGGAAGTVCISTAAAVDSLVLSTGTTCR